MYAKYALAKSVTLNDLEGRNGRYFCVISRNLIASGAYNIKVVEDIRKLYASQILPTASAKLFSDISLTTI